MRRTFSAILGALLLLAVTAGPARADGPWWPKTSCLDVGDSASICLDVYSHRMSGGGLTLEHVYLRAEGGFYEATAYACDYVEAWNDNGVVKWEKHDNVCDIVGNSQAERLFDPNQSWPSSTHLEVRTCGWPHLDNEPDPGRVCVHVNIP